MIKIYLIMYITLLMLRHVLNDFGKLLFISFDIMTTVRLTINNVTAIIFFYGNIS